MHLCSSSGRRRILRWPSRPVAAITEAIARVGLVLRPRLKQLKVSGDTTEVGNLIGSIPREDGSVLEIDPKAKTPERDCRLVCVLCRYDCCALDGFALLLG